MLLSWCTALALLLVTVVIVARACLVRWPRLLCESAPGVSECTRVLSVLCPLVVCDLARLVVCSLERARVRAVRRDFVAALEICRAGLCERPGGA